MSLAKPLYNEMSIVLPSRRREFLAPSIALQELKHKLGPIYFDAKLIECPQNAIELGKLLQKWEELDKQKFKKISETSREQRILQNTLCTRLQPGDPSTLSLARSASSRNFVEVSNKNAPPPGFRFHANGDPKNSDLDLAIGSIPDSKTSVFSRGGGMGSNMSVSSDKGGNVDWDDGGSDGETATVVSRQNKGEAQFEEIDYSKEIEDLEALILQLEAHLIVSERTLPPGGEEEHRHKHNYLRAHSNKDDIFEACLNRPSANYAYDPESTRRHERRQFNALMLGSRDSSGIKRSSKCLACQFKLKHVGNEFTQSKKKPDVSKEKWNIPPRGCFLPSPGTSSLSVVHKQSSRALELNDGRSFSTSPTVSPRQPATRAMSLTNSRKPSKKDLGRGVSSPCFGTRGGFISGRMSAKDVRPPSTPDITSPDSGRDLHGMSLTSSPELRGRSSASIGSPVRRFMSPLQRESRLQMLKTHAEEETKECQQKVKEFIGDLDKQKRLTRAKEPWRYR